MKVVCVQIPAPTDALEIESSPWVTLNSEYNVVSLIAEPQGRVQLHLLTDDGISLAWFDSEHFRGLDDRLPANWGVRLRGDGVVELGPPAWMAEGFWESFYDSDVSAMDSVSREVHLILDTEA